MQWLEKLHLWQHRAFSAAIAGSQHKAVNEVPFFFSNYRLNFVRGLSLLVGAGVVEQAQMRLEEV